MTIAYQIRQWIVEGREYYEGLAIYSRAISDSSLPASRGLMRRFQNGATAWNEDKLVYELDKVFGACPAPTDSEQVVDAKPKNPSGYEPWNTEFAPKPPEILSAQETRNKAYRIRDRLHADLCNVPSAYHSEAYQLQIDILKQQAVIDDAWEIIDAWARNGTVPAKLEKGAGLVRRLQNVMSYISKRKKWLLDQPEHHKRCQWSVELTDFELERDDLKKQLGYE